jgi:membrane protein
MGWRSVAKNVWAEAKRDNLTLLAAGVAFYAMLALVPSLIALVTVYALVADPAKISEQIEPMTSLLPQEAVALVEQQLTAIVESSSGSLTLGLVVSIATALWAASGGIGALITGINAVYDQDEKRGFLKLKALALGLTLGAVVVVVLALLLVAAFPAAVDAMNLGTAGRVGAELARWLLLAALVALALSVFYRVGPSRSSSRWRWLSWGTGIALVIWLLGSIGFSLYVGNFGSYNKTYGALAAVIILMLWLYLSAYVILLGAELDAELDRRGGQKAG